MDWKENRRTFLGTLGALGGLATGGIIYQTADLCGELTPDNPPYDLEGDGLFEDMNGDAELTYEDVLMYSHEGVWEEITGEDFGHAFNFSYDTDMSDIRALKKYVAQDEHDGLWKYAGDPIDMEFYRLPDTSETTAEQTALQTESALNNAAMRTDADWYADIDVETFDAEKTAQPEETFQEFKTYVDSNPEDTGAYTVLLLDGGEPDVLARDDATTAAVTGIGDTPELAGNPLFTRDRSTVLPVRAAGVTLGMETHQRAVTTQTDELVGDLVSVLDPMHTNTIEDNLKYIEGLDTDNSSGVVEKRPVTNMSYTTLYLDEALESVDVNTFTR